jgi:hypothetical protein
MSDIPPPPLDPLSYYAPHLQPSRRPLSVSIIGWVAAIFGGIGILSGLCVIIQRQFFSAFQPANPMTDMMYGHGAIGTYMTIIQIVGWLVYILLLIAGIGCLTLKPWARRLMIGLGIYQIISVFIGIVFNVVLINPAMNRLFAQHPNDPGIRMAQKFAQIGEVVGVVLGLVLPLVVIYFLTRPRAMAAFESPPPLPPT